MTRWLGKGPVFFGAAPVDWSLTAVFVLAAAWMVRDNRGMSERARVTILGETKIFDPADGFGAVNDAVQVTDASVAKRDGRWWMCLAGRIHGHEAIQLFSARLPKGASLSPTGWVIDADPADASRTAMLAGQERSAPWDLKGGRHCPAYVKGWDPARGAWVERVYYAGGAENLMGPYTIGYLEWDTERGRWEDQAASVFAAREEWERGSVYEPNLVWIDGKWRMWYVAGSNAADYLVQGYAESLDGREWVERQMVFAPELKVFDFNVLRVADGWEAVYSRVHVGAGEAPVGTGLWWCRSDGAVPSADAADWSEPVQIMTAADRGWHTGPWRPSLQMRQEDPARRLVFFDGVYRKANDPSQFPFNFTLGCLEFRVG
jgi:hypothetical protein